MRVVVATGVICAQLLYPNGLSVAQNVTQVQESPSEPKTETPIFEGSSHLATFVARYRSPSLPPLPLGPSGRARALIRNGSLYLSLYDAIALAIENNLNVEVGRYNLSIAGADILRASGGGNLRGLDYSVAESPTGVGGPGSPLLNSAASSVTPSTPTVNDLTSLNVLSETTANLSVQPPGGFAVGPPVPLFQPTLVGQTTFFSRSNTTGLLGGTTGTTPALPDTLHFVATNYALVQGFRYGTQLEVGINNAAQALFSNTSRYNPFSSPNTSVSLTQPLLRGRDSAVNLRYLRISGINRKITRLLFYQQLISTVYGISRLYFDLVSLNENVQVKRESLTAAHKLFEDEKLQVEQGTLAPLELTRAQSLVSSSELDLIQAQGLVRQQEVILKTQLSREGSADPALAGVPIVPTDRITVPETESAEDAGALVTQALAQRPDILQASLQVESSEISLAASQNAAKPQIDVVGNFQTKGSSEMPFTVLGSPGTGLIGAPADLAVAGLRLSRIYQAGLQINLPLRNRVAQADAARDLLELRQAQAKTQLLKNQVREQVENALIARQTARIALNAAIESRKYQEQLLDAEKDKLSVGASTSFQVILQSTYLAQARSSEVAARSVWVKAQVALDRAIGNLLDKNGIRFDDAVSANLPLTAPAK